MIPPSSRPAADAGACAPRAAARLLLLLAALLAAAAAPPAPADDAAPDPTPPTAAPPRRIISCAPNLTEILFAIGAGDRVVGVDAHSRFPPEAAGLPRVGDLFAPDLEAMLRLRPDAVVLVPSNRRVREFFAGREGVRVIECNDANSLAAITATITQLGDATGCGAGAAALLARHQRVLDGVRRAVLDHQSRVRRRPPDVLLLFGRQPGVLRDPWVVHPHGYLGELAALLFVRNVVPEDLPLYAQVDLERIIRWRPDVILELRGSPAPGEDAAERARALAADWERDPVVAAAGWRPEVRVVADDALTIPGARLDRTLAALALALRPDLFGADADPDALLARLLAEPEPGPSAAPPSPSAPAPTPAINPRARR